MNVSMTLEELKVQYPVVYQVFYTNEPGVPENESSEKPRVKTESVHDMMMRRGAFCYCKLCRDERAQKT